ncbi:MAG: hypothetical protein ACO1O1_12715 [Adhaeribacter sp.]
MKKINMLIFLGAISLSACSTETKTTDHTDTTTVSDNQASAGQADYEAEARDRANRMATRMATDLKFDPATQSKVEGVYYNRNRRVAEIEGRYNMTGTNVSGGLSAEVDTTGMYNEIKAIDVETETELRNILSPDQYKSYETNRSVYFTDDVNREVETDGDEIKVKSGDIKVKAEPGESKVETSTYESKIDGEESKFKTKDTKIKSEPGKTKYENENVKIKIKERD